MRHFTIGSCDAERRTEVLVVAVSRDNGSSLIEVAVQPHDQFGFKALVSLTCSEKPTRPPEERVVGGYRRCGQAEALKDVHPLRNPCVTV